MRYNDIRYDSIVGIFLRKEAARLTQVRLQSKLVYCIVGNILGHLPTQRWHSRRLSKLIWTRVCTKWHPSHVVPGTVCDACWCAATNFITGCRIYFVECAYVILIGKSLCAVLLSFTSVQGHTFRIVLKTQALTRQASSLLSRIPRHKIEFSTRLQLLSYHEFSKVFSTSSMMCNRLPQHQGPTHRIGVQRRCFAGAAKKGKLLLHKSEPTHATCQHWTFLKLK